MCLGWGGCQCVPRLGWMSMCALVGVDVNVCLGWGGCQCVPRKQRPQWEDYL